MKSRKVKAYNARKKPEVDLAIEGSDDSDINPDSFYHDEIDDFNDEKDNELSTDDELIQQRNDISEEEEVLPITDDEKDESEDDGESEDDDERDLPNREAWGKKKSMYYSADFIDQDRGRTYREEDAEAAKAEEEEALAIQKSVYSNINADNLGAHLFFESAEESSEEEEKVDKISATKQEILKYLRKETKIFEYKALLESSVQKLKKNFKLWHLIETKQIKSKKVEQYIRVKKQILSLIIHNINMYYMFASTGKNPKYHPVNQRIAQFKQFLDNLESTDHILTPAIDQLLEKASHGEEMDINSELEENIVSELVSQSMPKDSVEIASGAKKIKKSKVKHVETENEKEVISLINEVKDEMRKRKFEELDKDDDQNDSDNEPAHNQDENNAEEKRIISYQIAKNKGLVPHRKKEYRNPRVRHRMKYRKAQIRRKGQVRGVIKEIKRYEGEPTGINANVVKSIKFK